MVKQGLIIGISIGAIIVAVISIFLAVFLQSSIPTNRHSKDPSTFANTDDLINTHIDLELTIDFTDKILFGQASLQFKVLSTSEYVILDVLGLEIESITIERPDVEDGVELKFEI